MIDNAHFKYYTSQNFVIEPSFWTKLKGKLDILEVKAQETVENGQKLLDKSAFVKEFGKDSDVAYQVYLLNVNNYAWAKRLNAPIDNMITE